MNVNTATIKDWKPIRLIDICNFIRGTEPGSDSYNKNEGVKFFRVSDISSRTRETIYTNAPFDKLLLVKPEDVVISMDGSPGVVAKGLTGAISSGMRKIVLKNKDFDLTYIYFLLQTKQIQDIIKLFSTGVTILHASKSIPNLYANIPPLPEQQTIATILSKIQEAIENQDKIIKTTTELKKSLMKKIFSEGLNGEPLKQTEIGKIPKSWDLVKISDLTKVTSGGTPSRTNKELFGGDIPWLKSGELNDSEIWDSEERITKEALEQSSAKVFPIDTVLIAMYGATVGKCGILKRESSTNQAICAILPNQKFDSKYLMYYLMTQKPNLLSKRYGGAQPNISQAIIKNTIVPLPNIEEQRQISHILSAIDAKIENAKKLKSAKEDLFKSMLNNLMSGKIRVNNLRL